MIFFIQHNKLTIRSLPEIIFCFFHPIYLNTVITYDCKTKKRVVPDGQWFIVEGNKIYKRSSSMAGLNGFLLRAKEKKKKGGGIKSYILPNYISFTNKIFKKTYIRFMKNEQEISVRQ